MDPILAFTPQQVNRHRVQNALYGYRGQPHANPFDLGSPEYIQIERAYRAGNHRLCVRQSVAERVEAIIIGKKADRFCRAAIVLGAMYVLWLTMQAIGLGVHH